MNGEISTPAADSRSRNDWTLLYHTILVGVSALIPLPFVDDAMAGYFRRRLLWRLASKHGVQLTVQQVRQVGQEQGPGCASGCLMVVSYVAQEIIQIFLPWLKWQRSVDRATEAYYTGYLWDMLLGSRQFDPGQAARYGPALQRAREGTNTALVQNLIRATFNSSRGLLSDVARNLMRFWGYYLRLPWRLLRRSRRRGAEALGEDIDERQPKLTQLVADIVANLTGRLGTVPQGHFDRLRERLRQELQSEGLALD